MSTVTVAEKPKAVEYDDDDLVTVIHRQWHNFDPRTHQPYIRDDQETYLDRITFVGGVARNVPYATAKAWVKLGLISNLHIFPNNAQADDFAKATGRDTLAPQNLASAVATLSPEKATAILGEEAAKEFAKSLLRLISSREKAAEAAEQ
jgi:hypothetical protein